MVMHKWSDPAIREEVEMGGVEEKDGENVSKK